MDPLYEQRLREEVIYLHSLWHQGPPRAATAAPVLHHHLQPSKTIQFKKQKNQSGKRAKGSTSKTTPESISSPGAEWPCPASLTPPSTTGWPSLEPEPNLQHLPLSPEEQLKLAAKHAHHKALKVVQEFFRSNNDNDSDAVDTSSDEDDELMEEDCGRKEYNLFVKIFAEDAELREYYEKNFGKGEFSCLVCGAVGGKKTGKKFNGCLPLVQHSVTIANTKKKRAHRAYGQAVCKVLGWDIDHLATIVSLLSDKSNEAQGTAISDDKESSMTFSDNVDSMKSDTLEGKIKEPTSQGLITNSSTCAADTDNNLENLGMVSRHNTVEPASQGLTIVGSPKDSEGG